MIDIGANLAHDSFDVDRPAVLQRAWDAGLCAIIVTGSDRASAEKAAALAAAAPSRLFATAGLHPHHASAWSPEHAAAFRDLAQAPHVVALGECGLDYFRNYSPHADQRRAFTAQLALATELGKPVFLHQRDAHADFIAIVREFRPQLVAAVVHCFTDTADALRECLALDLYVGITGWICDERRGGTLRAAAALVPDERLLIETDAPYLLPRTVQPCPATRRNEPMYLPWVATAVAQARAADVAHVARVTRENAVRFFRLPAATAG